MRELELGRDGRAGVGNADTVLQCGSHPRKSHGHEGLATGPAADTMVSRQSPLPLHEPRRAEYLDNPIFSSLFNNVTA